MFKKLSIYIIIIFMILAGVCTFMMSKVKVNYDITRYLSSDSKTKQALDVLEEEFGNNGYLQIMIENIEETEINNIHSLLNLENVKNISNTYKDNDLLLQVTFIQDNYDATTQETLQSMINILDSEEYTFYMNSQAFQTYNYNKMIKEQIPKIMLFLIPIILLILFLTTVSYVDPIIFIIVVLTSIALNMGTNALLKDVSYMTNAIGAILQFAICMDYSIILLNRYRKLKEIENDATVALKKAWKSSVIPILASSLTTVAGFVAIMFMRYKIGLDIGVVLTKGVILTLITALCLMPCLILVFDKAMEKTKHKQLFKVTKKYNQFLYKTRFVLPVIALIIIGAAVYFQGQNTFKYSDNTFSNEGKQMSLNNQKIEEAFGVNNQIIIMLDKDIDTNELINKLTKIEVDNNSHITNSLSLDKQMAKEELLIYFKDYQITADELDFFFSTINQNTKETLSLEEIFTFFGKLVNFDTKMNSTEMYNYVNNFFEASLLEVNYLYQLLGKDELTLKEIITTLKNNYTSEELVAQFGNLFDTNSINIVYQSLSAERLTLFDIMNFYQNILNTKHSQQSLVSALQNNISLEEVNRLYLMFNSNSMSIIEIFEKINNLYTQEEMTTILGIDATLVDNCYQTLEASNQITDGKATLKIIINFILDNYETYLTTGDITNLNSFRKQLVLFDNYQSQITILKMFFPTLMVINSIDHTKLEAYQAIDFEQFLKEFVGENYQRIILTTDLSEESEQSFEFFTLLEETLDIELEKYYLVSNTTSVMDIKETSSSDYKIVTIISIALVFIIIALSFMSISIPLILVVLIEGAIFINMSIPAITNEPLFFTGYLLVSCIQLGATIDYGILMSNRYITNRKTQDKKEAMSNAISDSITSILTSGLILAVSGLLLAIISEVPVIAILGRLIGIGGITSILIVVITLPQVLYISDKFILKTTYKANFIK